MKITISSIIITIFILPAVLSAMEDHGPVIRTYYAPYGAGFYMVPHDKTINGGGDGLTSDSSGSDETVFHSLKEYSISGGYFYDWFQGDISYKSIKTAKRYVVNVSTPGHEHFSDASLWYTDVRAGYRFSKPGDTSYNWLYAGIRKMNLNIPYNNTNVDATGFLAGFYCFNSFGLSGPFELVLTYDVFAGTYRRDENHLSTDVNINIDRKYAVDFGLSTGIGVQYEPWDLAVILKVSSSLSEKKYKGQYNGSNAGTDASLMGATIGIEVILTIPDYKNNIVE